jgi:PHD/YefM family antitoxin component YafN of YafNO toxin-antitoxin module
MITRHGRPAGYLIGYEALNRLLRRLEDLEDIRAVPEAKAEWRAEGGQPFAETLAEVEAEEAITPHVTRELVPDTPVEVLIPESAREESKEQAFLKRLARKGLLASKVSRSEEAPFKPVPIEGPPLSQTIIEERR